MSWSSTQKDAPIFQSHFQSTDLHSSFPICSEGLYHNLWAYYIVVEDGVRQFKMVLLDTCNGTVLKQVESFFAEG
jgi:hypothetical protein